MDAPTTNSDSKPKGTTICLDDFDCIGLDIDHTLCKYRLENFFPHAYNYSAKNLVEKGYDESLLEPLEVHKDLCIKGLVFDVLNGDFLKLTDTGIILRACHGTRPLSDAEIQKKYGPEKTWQHFNRLESTLEQSERFGYSENYYDLPSIALLARIIDLEEKKIGGSASIDPRIFRDVVEGYVRGFLYQEKSETVLSACEREPEKYLQQCSQHLKTWLRSLKDKHKMVFLLSSAHPFFANHVMKYILGEDWRSYFNICLLQARKPGFFYVEDPKERPFYALVDGHRGEEVSNLEDGQCYLQGNIKLFNNYIKEVTGKDHPKVLYFGDSLRSDIYPSNVLANWQSVLVLEEMEVEDLLPNGTCTLADTEEGREENSTDRSGPCQLEREFLTSNQWGSFFGDHQNNTGKSIAIIGENDNETIEKPVVVNTLWTRLMRTYADIAIPKLDYMADFPSDFKFETFSSEDWRKGFHPGVPKNIVQ